DDHGREGQKSMRNLIHRSRTALWHRDNGVFSPSRVRPTFLRDRVNRAPHNRTIAMSIIRLMIVDDHPLFRRGVRQLVDMDPELIVVAEASDGIEAVNKAVELSPNLVLLDLNMHPMDGIEVLRRMRDARVDSRIVMLTVSDADEDVVRALRE